MASTSINPKAKGDVQIINLKENAQLLESTAILLNSEWPRSMEARLKSLEASLSTCAFPVSFIMVHQNVDGENMAIGHSRALVPCNKEESCYVQSVVIAKPERGKGYGKMIMEATENYAKKNNLKWMYLKTDDQVEFYTKLGYEICQPFTISESSSSAIQEKLKQLGLNSSDSDIENPMSVETTNEKKLQSTSPSVSSIPCPPPPPPPIPSQQNGTICAYVYMKKELQ